MAKTEPGKYSEKIKDYGLTESSAGALQDVIAFYFNVEGDHEIQLNWYGHLKSPK